MKTKTWLQEKEPYLRQARKLLNRPLWKDKPYSNAVHVIADLLEKIDRYTNQLHPTQK